MVQVLFWTISTMSTSSAPPASSTRRGTPVFAVAAGSSAYATLACVPTWLTDFRADLPKIDVPLLVVQGTEDRILPIDATGRRLPDLVSDIEFIEIEGGPHNVGWTHPEDVNEALLKFIG